MIVKIVVNVEMSKEEFDKFVSEHKIHVETVSSKERRPRVKIDIKPRILVACDTEDGRTASVIHNLLKSGSVAMADTGIEICELVESGQLEKIFGDRVYAGSRVCFYRTKK